MLLRDMLSYNGFLFRLNVYEYSPQGMTGLVNYFFEHDQYELPADYTVSDSPPFRCRLR